jgi:predicted MFS family arabinose efflux permease
VLSDLGTRISGMAVPLLILALTRSPARAGIAEFAAALPLFVLTLPAGALVDRWNRKRLMVVCDAVRCLAYSSLVAALALDRVHFVHILAVVLADGCGNVLFDVAERASLRHVVTDSQLPAALAQNQAREWGAILAGTPLGGLLYSLGRLVPFLFDAVSYGVSVLTLSFVSASLQGARVATRRRILREVREGLAWFWRQPFIRTTTFLFIGVNLTSNALFLVVIVLARQRGASPALIGATFAFIGVGGLLGSFVATRLARRVPIRVIVIALIWVQTALLPLLFLPGTVTPGIVYGAMFLLSPAANAAVGTYRLRVTPDELLGRVTSVQTLLSLGAVPFAFLGVGFALEAFGTTPTLLALIALMLAGSVAAFVSPALRSVQE